MTQNKRRQYGSGSVYRRGDGRWVGTLEAGYTARGTRRRISIVAPSRAEARRRLKQRQRQLESEGSPVVGASGRTTVKRWAEQWLEITQHSVRPKAWSANRSAVRNWIIPTIGHRRLEQLTPGDVRAVTDAQRKAGRAVNTFVRTHAVLTKMLNDALVEGHRIPPRVLAVKGPQTAKGDRGAIPLHETLSLLRVAGDLPDGTRWLAALVQGMRQGECLGLTWECVDLDALVIDVAWQLQPLPYLDREAGTFRVPDNYEARHLWKSYHLVRPKTAKGSRIIPLVPAIARPLAHWREAGPSSPHDLVWCRLDGKPINPKTDLEEWRGLQGTAEVGHPDGRYYDLHEARHAAATFLLEAGTDPLAVTEIMGHSSIVTSRGYQHVSQRLTREALESVTRRLELE